MCIRDRDHLAYYRLLHFWALALLVYAWTRWRPLRLQSWVPRLIMACGMDSLVIYSSILLPVSYTHLDVYKRQILARSTRSYR